MRLETDSFLQQNSYESFYSFLKDPFALIPIQPLFFDRQLPRSMEFGPSGHYRKKGFILLTGENGIGKTTLMALVYLYLTTNGESEGDPLFDPRIHRGPSPGGPPKSGFPAEEENKSAMLSCWMRYPPKVCSGETVAMIFDEAQNLRKEVLEEIRCSPTPTREDQITPGNFRGARNLKRN